MAVARDICLRIVTLQMKRVMESMCSVRVKTGEKENKSLFVSSLIATVVEIRAREEKGWTSSWINENRIRQFDLLSSSRSRTIICLKDWDIRVGENSNTKQKPDVVTVSDDAAIIVIVVVVHNLTSLSI